MLLLAAMLLADAQADLGGARTRYTLACGACHGDRGDGRGEAAARLDPRPRDLLRGVFSLRSTPTGSLPTDEDLARTIRRGVPGTSMPAFAHLLPDAEIDAIVQFVKRFSARFSEERPETPVPIPPEPPDDARSREEGAGVYRRARCADCHGPTGRGDGPSARTLRDDQGVPIRAYDFTRPGRMKGGDGPADIYRTLVTGMDGTPMPSYRDALAPGEIWPMVHYVRSLVRRRTWWDWLMRP
jgi:mono/diheme cytochrome c family protein